MHLPSLDSQKSQLNKKFWHVKSQKIMSKIKFKIFSGAAVCSCDLMVVSN